MWIDWFKKILMSSNFREPLKHQGANFSQLYIVFYRLSVVGVSVVKKEIVVNSIPASPSIPVGENPLLQKSLFSWVSKREGFCLS
jgi:hypothetical protein